MPDMVEVRIDGDPADAAPYLKFPAAALSHKCGPIGGLMAACYAPQYETSKGPLRYVFQHTPLNPQCYVVQTRPREGPIS